MNPIAVSIKLPAVTVSRRSNSIAPAITPTVIRPRRRIEIVMRIDWVEQSGGNWNADQIINESPEQVLTDATNG